jgi:hypothetical protein
VLGKIIGMSVTRGPRIFNEVPILGILSGLFGKSWEIR